MNEVLGDHGPEVAPDGAGRSVLRIGGPHHRAPHLDRVLALDPGDDDRTRRDEPDELVEERLLAVLLVVRLGELAVNRGRPHLGDAEPLRLEPAKDLAHETPANRVRLDDEQRRLIGHHGNLEAQPPTSSGRASPTV